MQQLVAWPCGLWIHCARTTLKIYQLAHIFIALGLPVRVMLSDEASWALRWWHTSLSQGEEYEPFFKYRKKDTNPNNEKKAECGENSWKQHRLLLSDLLFTLIDICCTIITLNSVSFGAPTRGHSIVSSGYSLSAVANCKRFISIALAVSILLRTFFSVP